MNKQRNWVFEPTHSKIAFSVTHFMLTEVDGFFRSFTGAVRTDTDDFSDVSVELTIPVEGIDTQVTDRDAHLLNADFLQADKYPNIRFKSSGLKPKGDRHYTMTGDLEMVGVSRPVELDVAFKGIIEKDPFGNTKAGFKVTGSIARKDWGITWNNTLDKGGVAVGDTVDITANVQLLLVK